MRSAPSIACGWLAKAPGDAAKSLLLKAIKHTDPDLEMPPKKAKLPDAIVADMEAWIKSGAFDPREGTGKTAHRPPVDLEAGRKFWSYRKPIVRRCPRPKDPTGRCASCHDHKSDPFSMEDYYGLAGVFKSTKTHFGNWIDSESNNDGHLIRLPELPGQWIPNKPVTAERVKHLKSELARMDREETEEQEQAEKDKAAGKDMSGDYFKMLQKAIGRFWSRGGIRGELERVDEQGRALPLCMGVMDATVQDSALYERGEIAHPGKTVPRGLPRVIAVKTAPPGAQSGRLEFASWLTFTLCFNRPPDATECKLAETFFQTARSSIEDSPAREQSIMTHYCQALLSSGEFRNAD